MTPKEKAIKYFYSIEVDDKTKPIEFQKILRDTLDIALKEQAKEIKKIIKDSHSIPKISREVLIDKLK